MASYSPIQLLPVIQAMLKGAVAAVDPAGIIPHLLQRQGNQLQIGSTCYSADGGRLFLLAGGKAAQPMAEATLEIIGDLLTAGIVVAKQLQNPPAGTPCRFITAGHPIPDERSLLAAEAVWAMLTNTRPGDLLLCLISGGMSALLSRPLFPLPDWQQLITALWHSGCPIQELNQVRQQFDLVKGGGLARQAAPAQCLSLILSDVIGNPLPFIGGGPTVLSDTTPAETFAILSRYQLDRQLAPQLWQKVIAGLATRPEHHPQPPPPHNLIIGDVRQAANAAAAIANQFGFQTTILTTRLEGEAREVGKMAAALAWDTRPGQCLILGGETTVTVRGSGHGGRNQELALAAAIALDGCPQATIVTFATDGEDGLTDAAGAIVSGRTIPQARAQELDPHAYLANNDSNTFFSRLTPSPQLKTGPTATNVNDLLFIFGN